MELIDSILLWKVPQQNRLKISGLDWGANRFRSTPPDLLSIRQGLSIRSYLGSTAAVDNPFLDRHPTGCRKREAAIPHGGCAPVGLVNSE